MCKVDSESTDHLLLLILLGHFGIWQLVAWHSVGCFGFH